MNRSYAQKQLHNAQLQLDIANQSHDKITVSDAIARAAGYVGEVQAHLDHQDPMRFEILQELNRTYDQTVRSR